MQIIQPYVVVPEVDGVAMMKSIERAARTCYKSEDKVTGDSYIKLIDQVIRSGHHSVLEHEKVTVRFIVDRGVSHELVRHRIASYSQESTRYCNYNQDRFGKEITVIEPWFFRPTETAGYQTWKAACEGCERAYFELLEGGATPQEARSVLPNSLKTEVVMTANLREWRHFLQLRCAKDAHPQMKEVAIPLLFWFSEQMLAVFGGIAWDFDFLPRWCAEVKKEGNK